MTNPYRNTSEAELQGLLVKEMTEHGTAMIEETYEGLQKKAVEYLARTVNADPFDLLTYTREATTYMRHAHLIQRADELNMNLAQLAIATLAEEEPPVLIEDLKRMARPPCYSLGERLYLSTPYEEDDVVQEGFMEVIIVGVEILHDEVRYQIGIPDPDGRHVQITDEWQDEAELFRSLPQDGYQRPPPRQRPKLTIVK